ncbi:ATP synthase F1 subunit gamma [Planctomycetota bacterium]|nr:ATP synthase F1 subunit gamma [Planctomycetota bacterium]MDC3251607.1 ATP synthase F1 subunit gamma [Planctomycetota bacterium]
MANARELKNKIRSVSNTKKITRTMEMISTAKAVVCQKRIEKTQPYGDKLSEILKDLGGAGGDAESGEFPLLRVPETSRREALLVVTANRGLCGGYNTNVLKLAEKFIREKNSEGIEVDVYVAGKKGIARFRYLDIETAGKFTQFEDRPTFDEAEEVFEPVMNDFEKGKIDGISLVFTHYESSSRQSPQLRQLLPLAVSEEEGGGGKDFILEPNPEMILGRLLPLSLKMQFFQVLVEAAASEQIARRIAMKNATDNAEEMAKTYTQLYNRTRQASITQEILEVIGGVEVSG